MKSCSPPFVTWRENRRFVIVSFIGIILGAVYYFLLIRIGIEDARTRKIRNKWTGALLLLGLLAAGGSWLFRELLQAAMAAEPNHFLRVWLSALSGPSVGSRLVGMVCISLPMLVLGCLVPGSIGGGDVKLMGAAGLLLGRDLVVEAFLIGVFPAGLYSLGLLLLGKAGRKDGIPFGPFLCLGLGLAPFIDYFCDL